MNPPSIELSAPQGNIVIDGSISSGGADENGIVRIKAGGLLRVNGSKVFTDGVRSIPYSIFADSDNNTNPLFVHLIQIKIDNKIRGRKGEGTLTGPGPKILIELANGPFSIGPGSIPNGESGTADSILIVETNGNFATSFRDRTFDIPDPRPPDPPDPRPPDISDPTTSSTLAAQTLEYDDEAGEQDSEEACSPADPACRPDEAGLLDVSAVLPEVPTR